MSCGRKGLHRQACTGRVLLRLTRVIINLGTLHVHLLSTVIVRTQSGRSLGAFRQSNALPDVGKLWTEGNFHIAFGLQGILCHVVIVNTPLDKEQ
jgi:hypothetical protein